MSVATATDHGHALLQQTPRDHLLLRLARNGAYDDPATELLVLDAPGACDPRHIQTIATRGACFKPRGVLHTRSPQATKGATRWARRSMRR
jgi:hypothetical protein